MDTKLQGLFATYVVLLLLLLDHQSYAYVAQTIDLHGCQGRLLPMEECSFQGSRMKVRSVTIYATGNATKISLSNCFRIQDCKRTIHSEDDVGLTDTFRHLYQWIVHKCEGKERCDEGGRLPSWWGLTGDFIDNNSGFCPKSGTKYFAAMHAHVSCVVEESVPTRPPPPETTPRTTPTTPRTTTPFNVYIPIYVPELLDREKIVLGVAIAISLAILILILITLYCCERYTRHKMMGTLLQKLGAPQADNDGFIDDLEEYTKPDEQWNHHNADCMAEYSGVKPDEFVTLDKPSMDSRLFIDNHTAFRSTNSCTTLNTTRDNKNLWRIYGQSNSDPEYQTPTKVSQISQNLSTKPLRYDSAENLDMERRMADELALPKNGFNRSSIKSTTAEADIISQHDRDNNLDGESVSSDRTTDSTSVSEGQLSIDGGDSIYYSTEEAESEADSGSYNFDIRELHVIAEDYEEEEEDEEEEGQEINHRYLYYTVGTS